MHSTHLQHVKMLKEMQELSWHFEFFSSSKISTSQMVLSPDTLNSTPSTAIHQDKEKNLFQL